MAVLEWLPGTGTSVELLDSDGGRHRSQVAGTSGERLTVLRPAALPPGAPVLIGAEVTVSWTAGENLVGLVAARIARISYAGAELLWELEPTGEPRTEQRRQWARVPASGPVELTEVVDDLRSTAPGVVAGELLDVSEVAVRCAVPADAVWTARRGGQVRLSFELAGAAVSASGRLLLSRLPAGTPGRREVVVQLEPDPVSVEELRRYVAAHPA